MIGTNIRGIRHLWRMSNYSLNKILVKCGDYGFDICEVFKTKADSSIGERMFIFNPCYNKSKYRFLDLCNVSAELNEISHGLTHNKVLEVDKKDDSFRNYADFFSEIRLLPESFDEDYASFLKKNAKMVKALIDKYHVDPNDIKVKRIYIYTDGSKHFFQWAMDLYFKTRCSMRTIINILIWNENYSQLTKKLSKGTITAYTSQENISNLLEELSALRNEKRINDSINLFNTAQKKLLKNNEQSKVDKHTLARFSKLSDVKKTNFIKKVSTIDDYQELMRQMRHVTSVHFDWNKESFMDFINNVEGINCELIYENDFVALVKVEDYETVKQLAKTTNWCISKNKTYWNNYIERHKGRATQYMVFDFSKLEDDKLSIVGFTTTRNKGITSAHNFVNDNMMNEDNHFSALMLKSYLAKFNGDNSIYTFLKNRNIDATLIIHYDRPQYDWNYEDLMSYLYECVDKNNVDIIKYDGNKLILSVCDENIKYFFGDSYMDNISTDWYGEQHIIFADFNMSKYDPNKLTFGIIFNGSETEEAYCGCMYNELSVGISTNFDYKLFEFGAPYDIIRRPNDIIKKVKNAFINLNVNLIKECIKQDKRCLHEALTKYIDVDTIFNVLYQSIIDFLSFDYLNIIYDTGHYLTDYLDSSYVAEILNQSFNGLKTANRQLCHHSVFEKPNEERIEAFYNEVLKNRNDASYIGNYLIIKEIIEHECKKNINFNELYVKILSNIYNSKIKGTLIKEIMYSMLNNLDISEKNNSTNFIVLYFARFGDEEMQDTVKNLSEKHPWVSKTCESLIRFYKEYDPFFGNYITATYSVAMANNN